MSQRVDISEVVHVDIVDNSTNPVIWRGVGESEEGLHSVEPAYNVKAVIPPEFFNFAICETLISSHLGVGSLSSTMAVFRFVVMLLFGVLRWGKFCALRHF